MTPEEAAALKEGDVILQAHFVPPLKRNDPEADFIYEIDPEADLSKAWRFSAETIAGGGPKQVRLQQRWGHRRLDRVDAEKKYALDRPEAVAIEVAFLEKRVENVEREARRIGRDLERARLTLELARKSQVEALSAPLEPSR